jgi:hypothetical protein
MAAAMTTTPPHIPVAAGTALPPDAPDAPAAPDAPDAPDAPAVPRAPTIPAPMVVEAGDFYLENGRMVFTATFHLRRGYCCCSRCRHCPYRDWIR